MALAFKYDLENQYTGLSTVAKPQNPGVLPGSLFYETDTGAYYIYDGVVWVLNGSQDIGSSLRACVFLLNRIARTLSATQPE